MTPGAHGCSIQMRLYTATEAEKKREEEEKHDRRKKKKTSRLQVGLGGGGECR